MRSGYYRMRNDTMVKRFLSYYRPHLPLFGLDFSCAVLLAGMDLIFPTVVRKMIDEILPAGNIHMLLLAGAGLLFLYGASYYLQYIVDCYGHVLGTRMEYDMRRTLFDHIQKLSFGYFDNTKTGHLMSRLVSDLNEISEMAHHGPEDLFVAIITLLGSFLIMASVNWHLTMMIFSLIPFLLWFSMVKNRHMQAVFRDLRVKMADINAQAEDSLTGIRVVKSFANEWYEKSKFERGNRNFLQSRENAFKVMGKFYAGITLFINLLNLIVLIGGGYFIYQGEMTVGALISFLLYVGIFLQPIRRLSVLMETYQKGMAGFQRFIEILDIHPDIADIAEALEMKLVRGNIEFDHVTFSYNNKTQVLKELCINIKAGEKVAVVGPSGGGKTTLCSLIPRFYDVDNGSIRIDGVDIRTVTQKSLREKIGIVQQDVFLFNESIRENIAYGKSGATDEAILQAAKQANAHEFIMALEGGYDTYIGERGIKLSGGQKQRLALARIFLKNPPILIFDEATSALDNETEKAIQDSLYKLAEDRTTLIIAHRLATIRRVDRIIVLNDEGIVEEGSHEDLLKLQGAYARLYAAQFEDSLPENNS